MAVYISIITLLNFIIAIFNVAWFIKNEISLKKFKILTKEFYKDFGKLIEIERKKK